ncbi:hypothetical protein Rhal01_00004 [Rubritalea halochordaticola]|uniref:Cardiolipin synthase N-terminal domain-containing protein n=1 Tax=Rubritalea halochordaticola TaxID=714537 RepID=A0ABP9UZR3_9BACT
MSLFDPILERISAGDTRTILGACSIGGAFLLISGYFIRNIWTDDGPLFRKLLWSFIVLVPLFGWLAYGGLYRLPESRGHC